MKLRPSFIIGPSTGRFRSLITPPWVRGLMPKIPFGSISAQLVRICFGVLTTGTSVCLLTGCHALPALPPLDLASPGWSVRQGQAVWRPAAGRAELTGELWLGSQANGEHMVEFTKPPFALASARQGADQWRVEFGGGQQVFAGAGQAPRRWLWFELPRALAGQELGRGWRFIQTNANWRIYNWQTGESLEGVFLP